MGVLGFANKIVTLLIIGFFLAGMIEATTLVEDTPEFQIMLSNATADIQSGDWTYALDLAKLSWGWVKITPTIPTDSLPLILGWYGAYINIFFPDGFFPIPGFEDLIYVFLVLIVMSLIGIAIKNQRGSVPLAFYFSIIIVILACYPLWCLLNLNIYLDGAVGVFGISRDAAYNIWVQFGEQTESFSGFLAAMSVLGVIKGGQIGISKGLKI